MIAHRNVIATGYVAVGLYFGFILIRDFDAILAAQKAFFDIGPDWYAYATTVAIAAAPVSCLATALIVYRLTRRWTVMIIAAHAALVLGLSAIALGAYLLWYYVFASTAKATSDTQP